MRMCRITLIALHLLAAGCRVGAPDARNEPNELRDSPGRAMVRTELFFGLGQSAGGQVSEHDWQSFLRDEITPRFEAGLTIVEARGQWRDERGVQREPSRVLIILHDGSQISDQRIEQIRALYKQRFRQDSVLRADSVDKVSF